MMDLFILFCFFYIIFYVVVLWKVAVKAGYEGWELLIPIYSNYILMKIAGLDIYWFLASIFLGILTPLFEGYTIILILIYIFSLYVSFMYSYSLAKKFNKGLGFGLGIFLLNPIFMPILAFSNKCVYNK